LAGSAPLTMDSSVTSKKNPVNEKLRRIALSVTFYFNVLIAILKLVVYCETGSLSVLAALVDSVLDIASQLVLKYTDSSMQKRSSALYPAGASRLEPVGVLTCAALMGMASFAVLKLSVTTLVTGKGRIAIDAFSVPALWSMILIVIIKLGLWLLCRIAANPLKWKDRLALLRFRAKNKVESPPRSDTNYFVHDSYLEALSLDNWNDTLSNAVAGLALFLVLQNQHLWFMDPVGAILISIYIVHSWYVTGKEQIEQLTGKVAPKEFLEEMHEIAANFDERILEVDVIRAYHFGPKFLVEIEVVLPKDTLLLESHDLGMELQYEIEAKEEVERCFVHMDYQSRPYDEHVVSKVPELREKFKQELRVRSSHSV